MLFKKVIIIFNERSRLGLSAPFNLGVISDYASGLGGTGTGQSIPSYSETESLLYAFAPVFCLLLCSFASPTESRQQRQGVDFSSAGNGKTLSLEKDFMFCLFFHLNWYC